MGDTIYSWFSICAPRVVTAVDQVTIQGQQRIRYKLEDINQVCGGIFYLIEGVGATSGLTDQWPLSVPSCYVCLILAMLFIGIRDMLRVILQLILVLLLISLN